MYPGESLAEVKERWSGDRMSEVRGGEQQGRHLQIDQLQTQKNKNIHLRLCLYHTKERTKGFWLRRCKRVQKKLGKELKM